MVALSLLVFFYLSSNKDRSNLLVILVFLCNAIAFNSLLKYYFKVPLDPSLHNSCWYAFPSGHLQNGIVFWGIIWIRSSFRKDLLLGSILALIAAGWATNYRQYHTVVEMLAAIPPAIFMVFLYYRLYKSYALLPITLGSIFFQLATLAIIKSPCDKFQFIWLWLDLGLTASVLLLEAFNWITKYKTTLKPLIALPLTLFYCLVFKYLLKSFPDPVIHFVLGLTFLLGLQIVVNCYSTCYNLVITNK